MSRSKSKLKKIQTNRRRAMYGGTKDNSPDRHNRAEDQKREGNRLLQEADRRDHSKDVVSSKGAGFDEYDH